MDSRERAAPSAAEAAAVLAGFKRDSEHADALHKSNPGAGEGNSRLVIDITYPLGTSSGFPLPRRVLENLSVVFRGMGVYRAVHIGSGHFGEVYSLRDGAGRSTGRAVKISKTASSLDSLQGGQAGTEAYAMYLGGLLAAANGCPSPFPRLYNLLAVPIRPDSYVSVLFMEEALRNTSADVKRRFERGPTRWSLTRSSPSK